MKHEIIFVDVDDTLVRSIGSKRIPIPQTIAYVKARHSEGATLYLWSFGGAEYAEQTAKELGIHACFQLFLSKPTTYVDDQAVHEWRNCQYIHPQNV